MKREDLIIFMNHCKSEAEPSNAWYYIFIPEEDLKEPEPQTGLRRDVDLSHRTVNHERQNNYFAGVVER